jgi:hypothetical protein
MNIASLGSGFWVGNWAFMAGDTAQTKDSFFLQLGPEHPEVGWLPSHEFPLKICQIARK